MKRKCSESFCKTPIPTTGKGLFNKLIDRLPVELHISGNQFCGSGTKLSKRLKRGDQGNNSLDQHCKQHIINYYQIKHTQARSQADTELAQAASKRISAKDASIGEIIAALGVAGIMAGNAKLGMGLIKKRRKRRGGSLKR